MASITPISASDFSPYDNENYTAVRGIAYDLPFSLGK